VAVVSAGAPSVVEVVESVTVPSGVVVVVVVEDSSFGLQPTSARLKIKARKPNFFMIAYLSVEQRVTWASYAARVCTMRELA
jgi:hypothetical protein